jgi:hypothetical protein
VADASDETDGEDDEGSQEHEEPAWSVPVPEPFAEVENAIDGFSTALSTFAHQCETPASLDPSWSEPVAARLEELRGQIDTLILNLRTSASACGSAA